MTAFSSPVHRKSIGNRAPKGNFSINKSSQQARDLYAWWPMLNPSSTLIDFSGHGRHAFGNLMTPADFFTNPEIGRLVPDFAGGSTAEYYACPSSIFNWPDSAGAVTISFWAKARSPTGLRYGFGWVGNSNNKVQSLTPHVDGVLYWDWGKDSGSGRVSWSGYEANHIDRWALIHLVASGTSQGPFQGIYTNGLLRASKTNSNDGPTGVGDFRVGHSFGASGSGHWNGRMFDFRIRRRMLSAIS